MAKRGRPSKKAKVEEPIIEEVSEPTIEEVKTEEVAEPISEPVTDDIYDLNSSGESKIGSSYNPFGDSVEEKAYRTPEVATAESIRDIDEPNFIKPTYDDLVSANEQVGTDVEDGGIEAEPKGIERFAQDEVKEMSPESQKDAAEGLTSVVLGLYSQGCGMMGSFARISDKKLAQLEADGEIDTSLRVPIDKHTTASVRQVVDSMNSQTDEAFEVTEEFKDTVKPVMVRVFTKRGWGLTDEQNLMLMFGMDLAQKVTIVAQMRSAANQHLEGFKEMHYINSKNNGQVDFEAKTPRDTPRQSTPQATQVVKDDVDTSTKQDASMSNMVASDNPDLQISLSDLAQVDVDNV
mgnify:FL=1